MFILHACQRSRQVIKLKYALVSTEINIEHDFFAYIEQHASFAKQCFCTASNFVPDSTQNPRKVHINPRVLFSIGPCIGWSVPGTKRI